jgi:hypothetical protein
MDAVARAVADRAEPLSRWAAPVVLHRALAEDPDAVTRVPGDLISDPTCGPLHVQRWLLDALPEPVLDRLAERGPWTADPARRRRQHVPDLFGFGNAGRHAKTARVALDPAVAAWLRAVAAVRALIANLRSYDTFDDLMGGFEEVPALAAEAQPDSEGSGDRQPG